MTTDKRADRSGQKRTKKSRAETGKRLIQARIPVDLHEWAEARAARENRSLANMVLHMLDELRRREGGG